MFGKTKGKLMNDTTNQADLPYFKIYPRDEIGDFFEHNLDYESYGVFCLLRNKIWRKNIEFDAKKIAKNLRISAKKFEKIWEKISAMFEVVDGKLMVADLEAQRRKYSVFIENQRKAGRASADKRGNVGSTMVQPTFNDGSTNTNPIPNPYSLNLKNAKPLSLSQLNALASPSADGDAGASESESEPLHFEDFKKYVSALKEAGKPVSDVGAYASKLFKDVVAHHAVRQWKQTGVLDYQKTERKKTPTELSMEAAERLMEKYRLEESEKQSAS